MSERRNDSYEFNRLASGLLWLSELIEENTKLAKVVGVRSVYVSSDWCSASFHILTRLSFSVISFRPS